MLFGPASGCRSGTRRRPGMSWYESSAPVPISGCMVPLIPSEAEWRSPRSEGASVSGAGTHFDGVADVLVQLASGWRPRARFGRCSSPCPDSTGGPMGASGLAPMTGTVWPSTGAWRSRRPSTRRPRVVVEKGGGTSLGDIGGIARAQRVGPVPSVEGGVGDQRVETGPEGDRGDDDDHRQRGAQDGGPYRHSVAATAGIEREAGPLDRGDR